MLTLPDYTVLPAGPQGPQRRFTVRETTQLSPEHDDDRHARPESWAARGAEPSGPEVHLVIWLAAPEPNHNEIGCMVLKPLPAGKDLLNPRQAAEWRGPEVETRGGSRSESAARTRRSRGIWLVSLSSGRTRVRPSREGQ
jgi:hypothetical protein